MYLKRSDAETVMPIVLLVDLDWDKSEAIIGKLH